MDGEFVKYVVVKYVVCKNVWRIYGEFRKITNFEINRIFCASIIKISGLDFNYKYMLSFSK